MPTEAPRLTITLNPKWMPELDKIKRDKFLYGSRADVLRYLIDLGLKVEANAFVVSK